MNIPEMDWAPLWLTMQLAGVTVVVLLLVGTPVAWWLAFTRSRFRTLVEAIVALPIVLPPTVLGFYLLVALGPHGLIGGPWEGPDRFGTLVYVYGAGDRLDVLFASVCRATPARSVRVRRQKTLGSRLVPGGLKA